MELMPINLFYEIVETRAERNSLFREEVFLHRQIKIYVKIKFQSKEQREINTISLEKKFSLNNWI